MEMFIIDGLGSSPEYTNASQLYNDKNTPYLYAYFKRRISDESSSSMRENYFKDQDCLYYNFNVKLTGKKTSFEQIKGYANIEDIGECSDGVHGYIKFTSVTPTGGGARLNPVTYTALNVGRYNLPQILFPGSDPDEGMLLSILAGLKSSFTELVNMTKSPIIHLVKMNEAKSINTLKSYVRLRSVGLHKKGGGQRVKRLLFHDSWAALSGGNSQAAIYGKQYEYTVNGISSGVASYEPLIGGDENPLRQPVKYTLSSGSPWPPNDPVDLYQECPIGESLYPSASVGYRKVTVTSVNSDVGRSSQGVDIYQFYTAKDFPVQMSNTEISPFTERHFDIFKQSNLFTATQGYALTFNDMHGKPKSVEHAVINRTSGTLKAINSQVYNYRQSGGKLDNNVNCLVFQPSSGMVVQSKQLGVESDITIDTRHKKEVTRSFTLNTNLNISAVGVYVIPIPLAFPWGGEYKNEFKSATVTKITQQYGILDNVVSFNEGAITTYKNELFDPQTGAVVVTSVNNQYKNKEYSVNMPAYWCYAGMGPAYNNINYVDSSYFNMVIDTNYIGLLPVRAGLLNIGDEISISYKSNSHAHQATVWYMGSSGSCADSINQLWGIYACCIGKFLPRFPQNTTNWNRGATLTNIRYKVVRPGPRNMLTHEIENYTTLGSPVSSTLTTSLSNVINLKARTYSDSSARFVYNYLANPDTINPFANGERGVYRLLSEYAYVTSRSPTSSGLFNANGLFTYFPYDPIACVRFPYQYLAFNDTIDQNWRVARTISKYSPNGKEVENFDAIGNYSTAVYGYNEELPTAAISNASQGDALTDGFEDYHLLQPGPNLTKINYSPFKSYFSLAPFMSPYALYQLSNPGNLSIVPNEAHTGRNSLHVPVASGAYGDAYSVSVPIKYNTGYTHNRYNSYYPYATTIYSPNEYLPFKLTPGKKYILSYWVKEDAPSANATIYSIGSHCGMYIDGVLYVVSKKSNIIEGWQQYEVTFPVPPSVTNAYLNLPVNFYVDDVRIFPANANMKSFVYHPINEKLMATLDENNFATFYEYDQEGNLVRTKKETERGIMTISESRSSSSKR